MAYYSTEKDRPDRYHECKNCHVGNNIGKQYLAEGKPPGARLCEICARLQRQGNCTPGTPIPAR